MMNNVTNDLSSTNSFFRRYLLGESMKNIFIRLTVILLSIIFVWCGIMFALIIHMKCQRAKQILKTSNTHHHLYGSNTSLTKKSFNYSQRNRRFHSSSSSLSSTRCYSIRHLLAQLKSPCSFWPSSSSSSSPAVNENSNNQSLSLTKSKQMAETYPRNCNSTPTKVQLVVESMSRRTINPNQNLVHIGKKISLYRDPDNSSGDELKNLSSSERKATSQNEILPTISTIVQLVEPKSYLRQQSISLPTSEPKDGHSSSKHLQKLHQFNTKATLFFHPITRRLSNAHANSSLPPINAIQQQQKHKQLLMVSSAKELTSDNEWKWKHSLINDQIITPDESRASSIKHLPLVMITDTSSSNTNIVELETFEDKQRLIGDIERRLSRELRASYRPRHST